MVQKLQKCKTVKILPFLSLWLLNSPLQRQPMLTIVKYPPKDIS